ncbi:hypothetical protein [Nocardia carnea]|uniref:hypothetical protein n=1 Tax=Nocardia carnea TaxID=37328 RepID=UPI00245473ED|nr:hypothetical protein [Nocardia carnea]
MVPDSPPRCALPPGPHLVRNRDLRRDEAVAAPDAEAATPNYSALYPAGGVLTILGGPIIDTRVRGSR